MTRSELHLYAPVHEPEEPLTLPLIDEPDEQETPEEDEEEPDEDAPNSP
jgi:hypothetical protein